MQFRSLDLRRRSSATDSKCRGRPVRQRQNQPGRLGRVRAVFDHYSVHRRAWINSDDLCCMEAVRRVRVDHLQAHQCRPPHEAPLPYLPDLHRPAEVRFLLFPRVYRAVPGRGILLQARCRVLLDHHRGSRDHHYSALRCLVRPPRIHYWHDHHYRKSSSSLDPFSNLDLTNS